MKEVWIVGYRRTPFGAFQGALSTTPTPQLGAAAIRAALESANVKAGEVSEVIMGCVLPAGLGQAPARQASLGAGIPKNVPTMTINKVCGSGMKAAMLAAQSIQTGDSEVVVAGGMENMSMAPYLLSNARGGLRMGDQPFIDSMIHDGLWDPYGNQHMGNFGDLCAREQKFSREEQDEFAAESFRRAQAAWEAGKFKNEVAPVSVKSRKGEVSVEKDEGPWKVKFEKIPQLKPAFSKEGSVTPANASSINDGAAAMVLASKDVAEKKGWKPLARVVSYGTHAQEPEWFTTAPVEAMKSALDRAGWKADEVDAFEVNEAFAVVSMAAQKDLNIPREKLNVFGGAISIGHPIGASGARITGTLTQILADQGKSKGLAGICIGGGEATAICLERI